MKSCISCTFFRPYKPLSQLIAQELGIEDQSLITELLKMMQDEKQKKDDESELLVNLMGNRQEHWNYKPQMTDYCGFQEDKNQYMIHQVKNADGTCGDFQASSKIEKKCSSCKYIITGKGNEEDKSRIDEIANLSKNAAALSQSNDNSMMEKYMLMIGLKKAFESSQTYYAGKITSIQPKYLSICSKFSSKEDYIPCIVQNAHNQCKHWTNTTNIMDDINLLNRKG